jgi:bifunctional hydroxylase/dehydrase
MLAGELRLAGIDVMVLEKLTGRTGESRGIGLSTRSMEVFDQRGLLRRLGEYQNQTSNMGHFGGIPLDIGVLKPHHEAARTIPQSVTEQALEAWATELGARIRRGYEFLAYDDTGDGVTVTAAGPDGEAKITTRYLVGCDGGRSTVRQAAGFDFPGTTATTEMFLADMRGVELEPRMSGQQTSGGFVMVSKPSPGIHRIIVAERGAPPKRRTEAPEFAEVADLWKRLTGIDISHAEPVWVSAFGDGARQVTEYRRGRVLLAGDAAHVHMPAGGQGMNTSIQDSYNLGWKLALVLNGHAPESLLDSYHSERHEVGERLLANTRAQGLLILGGAEAQPLREALAELVAYPEVAAHMAAKVSGLDIRYDVGGGSNPVLGWRMPHLKLLVGTRMTSSTDLLRPGRGVLLDLTDNSALRDRARSWRDRVDIVTGRPQALAEDSPLTGTAAVLLRPDGHVAWAAPGSHKDLKSSLVRWFGPAASTRR